MLSAVETKEALEREVQIFQERLLVGQRAWDASKQELSLLKKDSCELERRWKASLQVAAASQSQHTSFREKIAGLLRGSLGSTGSTEEAILEKIREMDSQEESQKRVSEASSGQCTHSLSILRNRVISVSGRYHLDMVSVSYFQLCIALTKPGESLTQLLTTLWVIVRTSRWILSLSHTPSLQV